MQVALMGFSLPFVCLFSARCLKKCSTTSPGNPFILGSKCRPIYKILSLSDSRGYFVHTQHEDSPLFTLSMFLHYLVKLDNYNAADFNGILYVRRMWDLRFHLAILWGQLTSSGLNPGQGREAQYTVPPWVLVFVWVLAISSSFLRESEGICFYRRWFVCLSVCVCLWPR